MADETKNDKTEATTETAGKGDFVVLHGSVYVAAGDERKKGDTIKKAEMADADRDRFLADGTIGPASTTAKKVKKGDA